MQHVIESVLGAPPPPPLPESLSDLFSDTRPEMSTFLGGVGFLLMFLVVFNVIFYSEDFEELVHWREFSYHNNPVFLAAGTFFGLLAYGFAFFQLGSGFQLLRGGHTFLQALMFYNFGRHLCKESKMKPAHAGMIVAFGTLPLVCLAVLQAEHVKVHSCRFFYAIMLVLALLPLSQLLREWRGTAFDPTTSRYKKRLFFLFFTLACFIGSTTPSRECRHLVDPLDHRQAFVLTFDLLMLALASDAPLCC